MKVLNKNIKDVEGDQLLIALEQSLEGYVRVCVHSQQRFRKMLLIKQSNQPQKVFRPHRRVLYFGSMGWRLQISNTEHTEVAILKAPFKYNFVLLNDMVRHTKT